MPLDRPRPTMTRLRFLLPLLAALLLPSAARADSASLMAQAQAAKPTRYAFAVSKGTEFRNTADGRSFTAWWAPAGTPKGVIIALHGHDSWALDEIALWQPYAEREGYAVLALQWWFGAGEATSDYYTPDEMYPILSERLGAKGVQPGRAMFIGYSRAAANTYALAALDSAGPAARGYFGFVFANSGGMMINYPPSRAVDSGAYGPIPYAGQPWGLYCGELDPDPMQSGCPAMTVSRDWVARLGGDVVLFIDDPAGDHGGFMTRSSNVESALATYAQVLSGALVARVSVREAECLFDWGEDRYAADLSPRRSPTLSWGSYTYRAYATSRTYLGVSSADGHLYFVDAGGRMSDLGPAATWSAQARCR